MFISSFSSKSLIWALISFPSLLVPCVFCFISLWVFHFTPFLLSFWDQAQSVLWASWLPMFWTLHEIAYLSHHCLALFLKFWSVLWTIFFCLGAPVKLLGGGALGIHQGGATLFAVLQCCLWGRDRDRSMLLACSALAPLSNELSCETGSFCYLCNPHSIWI